LFLVKESHFCLSIFSLPLPSYLPDRSTEYWSVASKKDMNADNGNRLRIFSPASQVCCAHLLWLKAASFQRQRFVNSRLLTGKHGGFTEALLAGLRQGKKSVV